MYGQLVGIQKLGWGVVIKGARQRHGRLVEVYISVALKAIDWRWLGGEDEG